MKNYLKGIVQGFFFTLGCYNLLYGYTLCGLLTIGLVIFQTILIMREGD